MLGLISYLGSLCGLSRSLIDLVSMAFDFSPHFNVLNANEGHFFFSPLNFSNALPRRIHVMKRLALVSIPFFILDTHAVSLLSVEGRDENARGSDYCFHSARYPSRNFPLTVEGMKARFFSFDAEHDDEREKGKR